MDRDGLWRLLVVLTARKAAHQRRDQGRLKRGGGVRTHGQAAAESEEESPKELAHIVEEYHCWLVISAGKGFSRR
jgi:hypothetical protein